MDDIRDHFVCGVCKAGFRSSSFLQYLEHMIRHFSVGRNNNCMICHKGFARIPTLKEHMLHFHAIPLKISPESHPETENADKTLPHGSARCNSFHKKEHDDDKGFHSNSSRQSQSQFTVNSRSDILDQSTVKTVDGIDNSEIAIDVLTIKDVEEDNITKSVELSPEQSNHFSNNCDEDSILALEIPPSKDINPNIFLIDPPAPEMNFDVPLSRSLSSAKYKGSEETNVAENFQSCKNDSESGMVSFDKGKIKNNGLCGMISKMDNGQCSSSTGNPLSLKSEQMHAFRSRRVDSSFSGNMNEQPENEENIMSCQNLVNSHHNPKSDSKGFEKLGDSAKQCNTLDPQCGAAFQSVAGEKGNNSSKDNNLLSGTHEDNIDFHFFLGTTVISGSSMTYNRIEFRCLHCPFVCAWRPSLVKHMKNIHKEALDFHKILDIKSIHSKSLSDENLKKYKVIKLSEYILANRKARKRKKRGKITDRQDLAGKYTCPTCNKVFRRLRYMRRHQMTHRTERNLLCDTCGKSFKTKATFVAHHRSHKSRCYHCPQCDFKSNLSSVIHRHRQIHPHGSVVCDTCGTAYIDKSTLKKHRRVHDITRPYPCTFPGCTWRFKTESLKKAHLQTHITEGKFRCLHCGYRFRHKHHLQRHLSRVHSQVSLPSKLQSDSFDLESDIADSSAFFTSAINPANPDNLALSSSKPLPDSQEVLLSSINENVQPSANMLAQPSTEIKMPETSVDIFVRNKQSPETLVCNKTVETSNNIGIGNTCDNLPTNNLDNLEYVTENGEVIQFVKPSQVYMRQDQYGNLVEYRITNVHPEEDVNRSQQVYFIGADGTVLGTGSQEQALLLP